MHVTKPVDLALLTEELAAAGISVPNGLSASGWPLETPYEQEIYTTDDQGQPVELPPGSEAVVEAHDARKPQKLTAFEEAEDRERLRVINERSRTDPAYAALADYVLKGKGTGT